MNIPAVEVCLGNSATLSSSSPYVISWFNPADTSLVFQGNSLTINPVQHDTSFLIATLNSYCIPVFTSTGITIADTLGNFEIIGDSIICLNQAASVSVLIQTENVQWAVNGTNLGTNPAQTISASSLNQGYNYIELTISNSCYSKIVMDSFFVPQTTNIQLVNDTITLCYYDNDLAELTASFDSIYWNVNAMVVNSEDLLVSGNITYNPIVVYAIDSFGCPTNTDTLTVITPNYYFSANLDFSNFCLGDSGAIQISTNADSLITHTPWNVDLDTSVFAFSVDSSYSGTYVIETWDSLDCHYTDNVVVPLYNLPDISILPDSIFCLNDVYTFYFPNDTNTYFWTDYGSNTSIPILFDQNLILSATSPQGCMQWDTLVVHTVDCTDPLPNIITPNNDGVNDFFIIDDAYSQHNNALIISNRWGNVVLDVAPYKNDFNGNDLLVGTYFFIYYPEGKDHADNYKTGFLEIVK